MSHTLDQFLLLAASLIEQGKKDLVSEDDYIVLKSAKYFFLKPAQGDDGDLKKFAGLCMATGIDADAAAKAIFDELLPYQQKSIRSLLRSTGYGA